MEGKTLLASGSPITQSIDAVKTLLAYAGRASDPLPTDVSFDNGRLVLVLNNKKDAYYTVTAKACSCPSAIYRHNGPCNLDEYMSLVHSGFGTSEIENMMGLDSYQAALAAVEKADMEYYRITTPPARPKRRGKPLELPKEHRYNECGLGVREDAEA